MRKGLWKNWLRVCLLMLVLCVGYTAVPSSAQEVHAASQGFKTTKGKTYFYDKNGKKHKGWLTYQGNKYYFNKKTGVQVKGWLTLSGKKYYFTSQKGVMCTGWLQNSKGQRRYFNKTTGAMTTGWMTLDGKKYHFNKSTGIMQTGFVKISGKTYYFDPKEKGAMKIYWLTLNGKKYYMDKNGVLQTGWVKTKSGKTYYFTSKKGVMATGWLTSTSGNKRYFDPKTGIMATKFQVIDGKTYYFAPDTGVMYVNKTATIGDKTYQFGADGVAEEIVSKDYDEKVYLEVMRKIIYAVETGGQVYGNCKYDDFTEAGTNSSAEVAITIGAGQWYATEARELLNLIRKTAPETFKKLDTAGIAKDMDTKDWSSYKLSKKSAKAKCIQKIISSEAGIKCQDQLVDKQMKAYIAEAKALGVTSIQAQMMCANWRHQGGKASVTRLLNKCGKPYTLDRLYKACQSDTGNQVGAYKTRQKKVYEWIKEKLPE